MCRKRIVRVRLSVGRKVEEYCRNLGKSDEDLDWVIEMDVINVEGFWYIFWEKILIGFVCGLEVKNIIRKDLSCRRINV